MPKDYYLRYQLEDVLWHLNILSSINDEDIVVRSKISENNVVDIFVLCQDFKGLFFKLVSVVERLGLDIVDAKILTTKDRRAYNTISVLQNNILENIDLIQEISSELSNPDVVIKNVGERYAHRHFEHKVDIKFSINSKWNLTQLELNTLDKQGVLSNVAYAFYELNISLINARISTMGERVEDIFFISNEMKQPLDSEQQSKLEMILKERL